MGNHASISWISPYFSMFLMFHNIVLFIIVQHQFADASRQAAALTRMITRAEALRLAQCQCGCQAAAIICTETRLGSGPSESESRADAGWHLLSDSEAAARPAAQRPCLDHDLRRPAGELSAAVTVTMAAPSRTAGASMTRGTVTEGRDRDSDPAPAGDPEHFISSC